MRFSLDGGDSPATHSEVSHFQRFGGKVSRGITHAHIQSVTYRHWVFLFLHVNMLQGCTAVPQHISVTRFLYRSCTPRHDMGTVKFSCESFLLLFCFVFVCFLRYMCFAKRRNAHNCPSVD